MSAAAWMQLAFFLGLLLLLAWPLARAIEAVVQGRFAWGRRVEAPLYRLAGIDPEREQGWLAYALGLLLFNLLGLVAAYALQRLQGGLPLNPQGMGAVAPDSAFNTAVSFVTNTDWQGYGGETTMSYLTQMLALTVQNFLSAATGIVVAVALVRGFARHRAQTVGNVWVDLTRVTLWILLPLSVVSALVQVSEGVIQNLEPYREVQMLQVLDWQGQKLDAAGAAVLDDKGQPVLEKRQTATQTLAMGPVPRSSPSRC